MTPTSPTSAVRRYKMGSDGVHVDENGRVLLEPCVAADDYDALAAENADLNERIARLEAMRRLWLDTDNNAKVMVEQEHEISTLASQLEAARLALSMAEPYMSDDGFMVDVDHYNMVRRMVRAALTPTPTTTTTATTHNQESVK